MEESTTYVDGLPKVDINIPLSDLIFEKKISKGGFGEVWKATYLGTDVAVKKMQRPDDAFLKRLLQREISALKEIRHPNICLFLGVCVEDTMIYLITEYIDGGTLWKHLKQKSKPLPWHTRLHLAVEVAKAMTFLHAKNIMHRDLKSENILVDRNMQLKVIDFGLSRGVVDERDLKFMTRAGTETWMAPEIIVGAPYSLKADVFSFGVLIYEIIVRDRPPDRSPMNSYLFEMETFKNEFPPDCPPELSALCVSCVAEVPSVRPSFMEILTTLKDLQSKLKDEMKSARAAKSTSKLPPPLVGSPILPPATPQASSSSPLLANLMPPPTSPRSASNLHAATPTHDSVIPPPLHVDSPQFSPFSTSSPLTDSTKLKKKKKKVEPIPIDLPPPINDAASPPNPTAQLPPPISSTESSSLPPPLDVNIPTHLTPSPLVTPASPRLIPQSPSPEIAPTLLIPANLAETQAAEERLSRPTSRPTSPDPTSSKKVRRKSRRISGEIEAALIGSGELALVPPPIIGAPIIAPISEENEVKSTEVPILPPPMGTLPPPISDQFALPPPPLPDVISAHTNALNASSGDIKSKSTKGREEKVGSVKTKKKTVTEKLPE